MAVDKEKYINKFKDIFKRKNGRDISYEDAQAQFEKLAVLVAAVYRPIPVSLVETAFCITCEQKILVRDFKDARSVNEFIISGLCQKCQDKTFI
jgi:hypothetical protein